VPTAKDLVRNGNANRVHNGITSWTELMQMILPAAQETSLCTPRLNLPTITNSKGSAAKPEFHVRQD
jgi:hypothetical protein